MSYLFSIVLTLALCFSLQSLALRSAGGRFTKSESNFFSSIGRIQAGARGGAEVMLLGSSITGRLPDRAQGFSGVANMGCDGGSAIDALRAMDAGILPVAPVVVIEANTLQLALDETPTEISKAMRGKWFRAGMVVPAVAAYARPSAYFYSKLLVRRIGGIDTNGGGGDLGVHGQPQMVGSLPEEPLTPRQEAVISEATAIIHRLKHNGAGFIITWLPPGRSDGQPPPPWILELASRSAVPYWDLGQETRSGTVRLTDGIHMDAASAARTMRSIAAALK